MPNILLGVLAVFSGLYAISFLRKGAFASGVVAAGVCVASVMAVLP